MARYALIATAVVAHAFALPASQSRNPLMERERPLKFDTATQTIRGVNLGGWFVLEPWITPSVFAPYETQGVIDEYTYTQHLGPAAAKTNLEQHWSSWITQDDFRQIAAAGLNFVRIPIGYWSVNPIEGDPYIQGAYAHLAQALDWAEDANLQVMIDLHGGPGSQNGFDNSGRKGSIAWGSLTGSINQTIDALVKIANDHASHPAVSAIELLNEPMGSAIDSNALHQFYYDGWGNLQNRGVAITIHDAFRGVNSWGSFGSDLPDWLLDTHHYEVFDEGQLQLAQPTGHVSSACSFGNQMAGNSNMRTISGEWTGAMTDCAKWLNGLGVGARYDGTYPGSSTVGNCAGKSTGTVAELSDQDKTNIGMFVEAQMDAYEQSAGWIFWTWKTEGAPEWDMQDLLQNGVFPSPVTSRNYGKQC